MNRLCRLVAVVSLLVSVVGSAQATVITNMPSPGETRSSNVAVMTTDLNLGTGYANDVELHRDSSDSYISLYLNDVLVGNFGGGQSATSANDDQRSYANSRYVNFLSRDSDFFDSARLTSKGLASESDNPAYAIVPEPGTVVLLALGLLGLGFARRQQQRAL